MNHPPRAHDAEHGGESIQLRHAAAATFEPRHSAATTPTAPNANERMWGPNHGVGGTNLLAPTSHAPVSGHGRDKRRATRLRLRLRFQQARAKPTAPECGKEVGQGQGAVQIKPRVGEVEDATPSTSANLTMAIGSRRGFQPGLRGVAFSHEVGRMVEVGPVFSSNARRSSNLGRVRKGSSSHLRDGAQDVQVDSRIWGATGDAS